MLSAGRQGSADDEGFAASQRREDGRVEVGSELEAHRDGHGAVAGARGGCELRVPRVVARVTEDGPAGRPIPEQGEPGGVASRPPRIGVPADERHLGSPGGTAKEATTDVAADEPVELARRRYDAPRRPCPSRGQYLAQIFRLPGSRLCGPLEGPRGGPDPRPQAGVAR